MTTAAPDVAVDIDVIRDLDWNHQPPCERYTCPQGQPPAHWRSSWTLCSCVVLWCDACRQEWRDLCARPDNLNALLECSRCGVNAALPMPEARACMRVEPLP